MFGRHKAATLVAEFLGTGALTLLILSVQRSTIGVPFFIAAAAGLTVALMWLTVGKKSGGYFNPALVIGFWTVRKINTATAVLYIAVQLIGAYAAYLLYTYLVNNPLQPVGGEFSSRILVAETVGTALFAFGVAAAIYQRFTVALTAATAGLALMIGIIAASPASLGLLNPAVALGVSAWVWTTYVLGPVLGAIIGVNLYALLFADKASSSSAKVVTAPVAVTKKPAAKKKKASAKKKK